MSNIYNVSNGLISIIFLIGVITLQIFLSKSKKRWLGLILPIINAIVSIMIVLGLTFYGDQSSSEIMQAATLLLIWNIPTVILFAIYYACGKKNRDYR